MDPKQIQGLGLTKNESITYLALLRLGTSKTGEILKESKLNSGKIYEILEALKEKGFVSESNINNVRHFQATPPSYIKEFFEEKKQKIMQEEREFKKMLPKLEALRNTVLIQPRTTIYTGIRGFRAAVEEATQQLKKKDEVLGFGMQSTKQKKYNLFWQQWNKINLNKKLNARYLYNDKGEHYKIIRELHYISCKVLQEPTPLTIDVFGKKTVLFLNYQAEQFILIIDEHTAQTFTILFNQLWKHAKT